MDSLAKSCKASFYVRALRQSMKQAEVEVKVERRSDVFLLSLNLSLNLEIGPIPR
jgi:hypothetical protein